MSHSGCDDEHTIEEDQIDKKVSKRKLKELAAQTSYNPIVVIYEPIRDFTSDSIRLINKCTKPDAKEFKKVAIATGVGFVIMGLLGFLIKLIHIPINNILIGGL